jgi:hypothetical protein
MAIAGFGEQFSRGTLPDTAIHAEYGDPGDRQPKNLTIPKVAFGLSLSDVDEINLVPTRQFGYCGIVTEKLVHAANDRKTGADRLHNLGMAVGRKFASRYRITQDVKLRPFCQPLQRIVQCTENRYVSVLSVNHLTGVSADVQIVNNPNYSEPVRPPY